jgi:hypothetical protein
MQTKKRFSIAALARYVRRDYRFILGLYKSGILQPAHVSPAGRPFFTYDAFEKAEESTVKSFKKI